MRGIDKFKERFAGHDGEYVLIGGGACDLLFGEAGQDFRATKDLDLVLLVEALTPEFFRERHSKTRPIVCLETGETFMGNPAAARPLHVSPAAISQAVRYGSPVNGLHFYHGDEPKPAPEFFKPAKVKGGKSPAAMAAAAKAAAGNSAPGTDYREHGIQRDRRAVQ